MAASRRYQRPSKGMGLLPFPGFGWRGHIFTYLQKMPGKRIHGIWIAPSRILEACGQIGGVDGFHLFGGDGSKEGQNRDRRGYCENQGTWEIGRHDSVSPFKQRQRGCMESTIYRHLLDIVTTQKVSDFHLHANAPLAYRSDGEIIRREDIVITQEELVDFFRAELDEEGYALFERQGDVDFAVQYQHQRFRASGYRMMNGYALVLRVIVSEVPHIDMLGLPSAVHDVLAERDGLVLVTGATGSGKSTSLAAMIDKINRERNENIITVEDPIEFIHTSRQSLITQREVGRDTESFARALKGALRQDPDIILMGELRDYETVSMAMTAAETGHLVFGTLHTNGAPETINRIIDVFPAAEQPQARSQLSQSLRLVLTQRLLPRKGGGRIGAFEVMVNVKAVANLIREAKIVQIETIMQTGAQHGMITMDKYLDLLKQKNLIN